MECGCMTSKKHVRACDIKVIDQHHRVGANIELKATLYETITQSASRGSHCVQFFLGGNQNYSVRKISSDDKAKCIAYCEKNHNSFYVHCPLIANLSRNPATTDEKEKTMLSRSWQAVDSEVRQMNGLPASCVLHMGSNGSINHLIQNLNDFGVPRNKWIEQNKLLCLENSAGSGSQIGRSFDEIRKIYEGIDKNTIGLCIDTQHTFGAGTNSLATHEDVVKLFDDIEGCYGGNPDVIHLNDSKVELGRKVDRHENIANGYIWSENDEGLRSLLDICYDQNIDCILETPDVSKDLRKIRSKYMDLQTIDTYVS